MTKKETILAISFVLTIFLMITVLAENNTINVETHLVNVTDPSNGVNSPQKMQVTSTSVDSSTEPLASSYIKQTIPEDYFNKHFTFDSIDNRGNVAYVKYTFSYDESKIEMRVAYDSKNQKIIPQMSSFLKQPVEITFSKEDANSKSDSLSLPEPRNVNLVYSSEDDVLAWKVLWNHEPTDEERANNTLEGYSFDATSGTIIQTYQFHYEMTNTSSSEPINQKSVLATIWEFILKIFRGH